LGEALGWAREQGLSAGDDLSYLRECEHITLAGVLVARYVGEKRNGADDLADGSIHEAIGLLERLLLSADAGGRMGSVIEILVLLSLAHQAQGNIPDALRPLERALTLAEPEGYVRTFVDEGLPMAILLEEARKHGIAPRYVDQLLAAFKAQVQDGGDSSPGSQASKPVKQGLVEPLSERELEVLRLLRGELSGPEIARELMVSLNTVHTHTKNIYNKLGVNSRRAAVRRAEELQLL
jgi:LuxR family maltose regulon positive regulatory protein